MIKTNKIILNPGTMYAFYVPTFEFNVYFQKKSDKFKSAVFANYDYKRQDMGFGMSHAFYKYIVNPGISVEDNLYFRNVFSDSTGIWKRQQAITPFLQHEIDKKRVVGIEFKIEREWSPKRRLASTLETIHNRSIKYYYFFQNDLAETWNHKFFYLSAERSYRVFRGEYNYLLLELLTKYSKIINDNYRYKSVLSFRGNLTPQKSPLFFIGGHSSLIGYENDEFWGRKALFIQNLFEYIPDKNLKFKIYKTNFTNIALIGQFDAGKVSGASNLKDLQKQDNAMKYGFGFGIGFTTSLPFMPVTDIHFLAAFPHEDMSDMKFYAGFGGWIH